MILFKKETCDRKINLQTQNLAKYRYFCLYFICGTCGIPSLDLSVLSDHFTDVISFARLCGINNS